MNAREFLAAHGRPDGDKQHAPWCEGDLIVAESLMALAADEARLAASRTPSANPPAPAPAAAPGGAAL